MITEEQPRSEAQFTGGQYYDDPDRLLVSRLQAGDLYAFEHLVRRHKESISRIIFNITKNHEDAEDQAQETFLRAYRAISEFRGDSKFKSWLTRIAMNQALLCLRKRRRHHISLDDPIQRDCPSLVHDIPERRFNPEQSYSHAETNSRLHEKLSTLPDALRLALTLKDFHDLSTKEVANELGITVAAVKSRILRARRRLRDLLGDTPNRPYQRRQISLVKSQGQPDLAITTYSF